MTLFLTLSAIVAGLIGLLLRNRDARRKAEGERDDAQEALQTTQRYTDAAKESSTDPAAARERLSRFGGGDD